MKKNAVVIVTVDGKNFFARNTMLAYLAKGDAKRLQSHTSALNNMKTAKELLPGADFVSATELLRKGATGLNKRVSFLTESGLLKFLDYEKQHGRITASRRAYLVRKFGLNPFAAVVEPETASETLKQNEDSSTYAYVEKRIRAAESLLQERLENGLTDIKADLVNTQDTHAMDPDQIANLLAGKMEAFAATLMGSVSDMIAQALNSYSAVLTQDMESKINEAVDRAMHGVNDMVNSLDKKSIELGKGISFLISKQVGAMASNDNSTDKAPAAKKPSEHSKQKRIPDLFETRKKALYASIDAITVHDVEFSKRRQVLQWLYSQMTRVYGVVWDQLKKEAKTPDTVGRTTCIDALCLNDTEYTIAMNMLADRKNQALRRKSA